METAETLDRQLLVILENLKKVEEENNGELPSAEKYIEVSASK